MSDQRVKVGRMRAAVAKSMTQSAAVPQFVIDWDVDPTNLIKLRHEWDLRPSIADMVNAAVVRTLLDHPRLNASWNEGELTEFGDVNLGLAVAVDDGIIAPAILRAQNASVAELGRARQDLQTRSSTGGLTIEEMTSATFTVSNLGTVGVSRVQPLVIPPQAAILGVPAPRRTGEMTFCLACDHRVTDGLPAGNFMRQLAQSLEEPSWMRDQ